MLAQPYWLIAYKKMDVGGGVPDAPCNLALLQNLRFTVGADSISARAALPLPQSKIFKKFPSKKEYFGNFYRIYI